MSQTPTQTKGTLSNELWRTLSPLCSTSDIWETILVTKVRKSQWICIVRYTLTLSVFRRTINLMIVVGFCGQYFVIGNAKHIHSFQISWTWGCGATFTVISRLGLVLSKNWCFDRGELWLGDCRKGLKEHETLVGVGKYWFSDIPVGGTPAQIC